MIEEHAIRTGDHETFYLAAGPEDGPLVIFVHGWPELSRSWRHQLPVLGGLGFRAVAPDMRGYGYSSVYDRHEDYALELAVDDVLGLMRALGRERALWVGHDWGAPVVWALASHHPEACVAVANLCVPYRSLSGGAEALKALIDREVYPEEEWPWGQWAYQIFYVKDFDRAIAPFDANPRAAIKALFRSGRPEGRGKPAATAFTLRDNGWFRGAPEAPDLPLDESVLTEADLDAYAEALSRNGFFGPGSWYMNHGANAAYSDTAVNGGVLEMPALFLAAQYDYTCECIDSDLAVPMRGLCRDLTEVVVPSGHWMAQECPQQVNAALVRWMSEKTANYWPG